MDISKLSITEITQSMGMNDLKGREWFVQGCTAVTGDGLHEGLVWLSKSLII